ncbi:MAG: hypothetical protein ABS92_00200 [Thiobacillus sp. SCN 63-374]|nr:MAG: hypothetical protein ABS92_00200 [Thiobacillus sp. SCN 63-374]
MSLLFPLSLACVPLTSHAAAVPVKDPDASGELIFDYDVNPPGTYTLQKIQHAASGQVLDTEGRARALADSFGSGKVTLLSFIYSSCADPNGCPYAYTVFHLLKSRMEREQPQLTGKTRLVSLSFDPERDTPEALKLYAGADAKAAKGVQWDFLTTASLRELIPILDAYRQDVYFDLDPKTGQALGTMSHVLKVFLIDRAGEVREIYTASYLNPDVVYNDILTLHLEDGATLK